mmetsp:Transcript_12871/g.32604  ORF Transcript_12871/g.32604 Transcript_12871/m.32604 type:complete len:125 (-) Transcript_12871:368-742(-)
MAGSDARFSVGHYVEFVDTPGAGGVVFELHDGLAGLRLLSQKLKDMGCGEETHEPVDNLRLVSAVKLGSRVSLKSDGQKCSGLVFEFQGDGLFAGLHDLSQKLKDMGCGEETHEPVDNLEELLG